MEIHQITPSLLYGDAIGNQNVAIWNQLSMMGFATSRIYAFGTIDARCKVSGHHYLDYKGNPNNVVIYHHAIGSPLAEFVRNLPDRVIVYYHNVTPPHFMRGYNDFIESTLAEGRDQTPWFKDAPYAWAASDYNREEMLQMGYRAVDIVPYIVTTTRLDQGVQGSKAQTIRTRFGDGAVNWLFVGRIVPNKRQDNLIRAFHYYHTLVNPNSRLIIVGSVSMAPGFKALLDKLVVDLNLSDCVFFEGPVGPEDGLGAYYQIATAFVCLSEHEGFCVPLLEAMHFDTPVVALKATGVPYALGDAGVLVRNLRFDVIAEVVDALHGDPVFRQRVTAKQRERENDFAPERATAQLHAAISKMCNM